MFSICFDCFVPFMFRLLLFSVVKGVKDPWGEVFLAPFNSLDPRAEGVFPYSSLKFPGQGLVRWENCPHFFFLISYFLLLLFLTLIFTARPANQRRSSHCLWYPILCKNYKYWYQIRMKSFNLWVNTPITQNWFILKLIHLEIDSFWNRFQYA